MSETNQPDRNYRKRKTRKKKSRGCLFFMVLAILLIAVAGYGAYLYFFGGDKPEPEKPVPTQTNVQQPAGNQQNQSDANPKGQQGNAGSESGRNNGAATDVKYGTLFGDARYLIHIHKQAYKLELFEKGKTAPVRTYGIAVARNPGDKQRTGDNRTPTSWGRAVAISKAYKGAEAGVPSAKVPFRVEEVCDASDWTHDFHDGKGVIAGAYGPWFISLDTGWDGIGIHGTHDPASIGTMASEGCLRLKNSDVAELKKIIYRDNKGVGTRVIITEE